MLTKENGFTFDARVPARPDRGTVFAFIALLAVLLAVYSNSFQGDWHFDDYFTIVESPSIRLQSLDWDGLKKSFYGPTYGTAAQRVARPAAYASFALNYLAGGTAVTGYHVVNFLIHVLSSFFLFLLIRLTLTLPPMREKYGAVAYPVALLSSFLWATSPLHVHAVSIIVQRMASMAGLGYAAALYFYARARTARTGRGRVAVGALCGAAALTAFATKENTAVFPLAVLLYDVFFIQGISAGTWKRALKWSPLPLAVVIALGLLYTDFAMERAVYESGVRPFSPLERLLTQARVFWLYLSLLLYPIPSRLMFLHDIDISRSILDPWTTAAAIAALALALAGAVLKARQAPLLSFAVLFFFLNHLVEGTLIPLELIFEHRNYIPAMFLFVPIAYGMVCCLDYFAYNRGFQCFVAASLALLMAFQGHTTFERNDVARSDVHLWLDNVRKAPNLSRPRINLAKHYYEAGMYDDAYRELKTAEELNRDTNLRQIGLASFNLGIYFLYQQRDVDRAEQQFLRALERFPGHSSSIVGLSKVYLLRGKTAEAERLLRAHAPRNPRDAEMAVGYGLVLLKAGDAQGALRAAAAAKELKGDAPQPWELSGEAWRRLGQWQKAAQCWKEVHRMNPGNPRAHLALVELHDRLGERAALADMAARCLVLKGAQPLDAWLAGLARDNAVSAYEVNPRSLGTVIRREVAAEMARR